MLEVEYLRSYLAAAPVFPSSPGADQLRVIDVEVASDTDRSLIAAGGVASAVPPLDSGEMMIYANPVAVCEAESVTFITKKKVCAISGVP
jgi:hypothetical protein